MFLGPMSFMSVRTIRHDAARRATATISLLVLRWACSDRDAEQMGAGGWGPRVRMGIDSTLEGIRIAGATPTLDQGGQAAARPAPPEARGTGAPTAAAPQGARHAPMDSRLRPEGISDPGWRRPLPFQPFERRSRLHGDGRSADAVWITADIARCASNRIAADCLQNCNDARLATLCC